MAAVNSDPAGFNQQLTAGLAGSIVKGLGELYQLMNSSLTYVDDQDALQPQLAETVPTVENGLWRVFPDGRMETTWRLRPNILWHDGAPFTAEDVLFTAQVYRDQDLEIFRPGPFRLVESVEMIDQQTLVVTWRSTFIEADTIFSPRVGMPLARHLLEPTYLQDKPNFLNQPYWRDGFVGTGPYRLVEWAPGSHLRTQANDRYVLGRPKLDEIEVKFLLDLNAVMANVLAGSVEMLIAVNLEMDRAVELRDRAPNLNVVLAERLGGIVPLYTQFIDTDPPIVANLQFRRALLQAIDRSAINDTLNYGAGPAAHTWLQPDRTEYRSVEQRIVQYPYDPRRAAQMFEGLGLTKGPDDILRDAAGQRIQIDIKTTDVESIHVPTGLAVGDYWKRQGIDGDRSTGTVLGSKRLKNVSSSLMWHAHLWNPE